MPFHFHEDRRSDCSLYTSFVQRSRKPEQHSKNAKSCFGVSKKIVKKRTYSFTGWLVSRVVSVPDSGAEGLGFKSQPQRCRVTVLGKLFTPIVPLFTKQQNW